MDTRMETRYGKQQSLGWVDNCSTIDTSVHENHFAETTTSIPIPRRQGPLSFKISSKADQIIRENLDGLSLDLCNNTHFKGKQSLNELILNRINRIEEKIRFKNCSGAGDVGCKDGCIRQRESSCVSEAHHKTTHSDKKSSCKYRSKKTYPINSNPTPSRTYTDYDTEKLLDKLRLYALDKYQSQNKISLTPKSNNNNSDIGYRNNYSCNPADIIGIPSHTPIVQQVYENKLDQHNDYKKYFEQQLNEENVKTSPIPQVQVNNYEYPHIIGKVNENEREEPYPHYQLSYNENEYANNLNVRYEEVSALKRCYKRTDHLNTRNAHEGIPEQNLMSCKSEPRSQPVQCIKKTPFNENCVGDEEHYQNFTSYINRHKKKLSRVCDNGLTDSKQHNTSNTEIVNKSRIGKDLDSLIRSSENDNSKAESSRPNIHNREEMIDGLLARIMPVQECGSDIRDELTTKIIETISRNGGDFIPEYEKSGKSQSFISFMDKSKSGNDYCPPGFIDQSAHAEVYSQTGRCFKPEMDGNVFSGNHFSTYNDKFQLETNAEFDRYRDDYCLDPSESALLRGYNIFDKKKAEPDDSFFSKCTSKPPSENLNQNGNSNKKSDMHMTEARERSSSSHSSSRLLDFIKNVPSKMMFLSSNSEKHSTGDKTSLTVKSDQSPSSPKNRKDTKVTSQCLNTPKVQPQNHSTSVDPVNASRKLSYEHRNNKAFQGREFRSKSQTSYKIDQKKKIEKYSLVEKYQSKYRKKEFENPQKKPVKPTLVNKNTSMYDKYVRKTHVPTYASPSTLKTPKDPRLLQGTKSDHQASNAKLNSQRQGDSKISCVMVNSNTRLFTEPAESPSAGDTEAMKNSLKETIRLRSKSHIYYNRRLRNGDDKNMGDAKATTVAKPDPTPKLNEYIRAKRPHETPKETPESRKARQCYQVVEPNIKPVPQADVKLCRVKKSAGLVNSVINGKTRLEGKEIRTEHCGTQGELHRKQKTLSSQRTTAARHNGRGAESDKRNQQLKKETQNDVKPSDSLKQKDSVKEKLNDPEVLSIQTSQQSVTEKENTLDELSSLKNNELPQKESTLDALDGDKYDQQTEKESKLDEFSSSKHELSEIEKQTKIEELGDINHEQLTKENNEHLDTVDNSNHDLTVKEKDSATILNDIITENQKLSQTESENNVHYMYQNNEPLVTDIKSKNNDLENMVKQLWSKENLHAQTDQETNSITETNFNVEAKKSDSDTKNMNEQRMNEVFILKKEVSKRDIVNLDNKNDLKTVYLVNQKETLNIKEQFDNDNKKDIAQTENQEQNLEILKTNKTCVDQLVLNDDKLNMTKTQNDSDNMRKQENQLQLKNKELSGDNIQNKNSDLSNQGKHLQLENEKLNEEVKKIEKETVHAMNNHKNQQPIHETRKDNAYQLERHNDQSKHEMNESGILLLDNNGDPQLSNKTTKNDYNDINNLKYSKIESHDLSETKKSNQVEPPNDIKQLSASPQNATSLIAPAKPEKENEIKESALTLVEHADAKNVKSPNDFKHLIASPNNTKPLVSSVEPEQKSLKEQNCQNKAFLNESLSNADPAYRMTLATPIPAEKQKSDGSPTCPQLTPLRFAESSELVTEDLKNESRSPPRPVFLTRPGSLKSIKLSTGPDLVERKKSPKEKAIGLQTTKTLGSPFSLRKSNIENKTNHKTILTPKVIIDTESDVSDEIVTKVDNTVEENANKNETNTVEAVSNTAKYTGVRVDASGGDTVHDIAIKESILYNDNDNEIKTESSNGAPAKDVDINVDSFNGENTKDPEEQKVDSEVSDYSEDNKIETKEDSIVSEEIEENMEDKSRSEAALTGQNTSIEIKTDLNDKLNEQNKKIPLNQNVDDFPNVNKSYIQRKGEISEKIKQEESQTNVDMEVKEVKSFSLKTPVIIKEYENKPFINQNKEICEEIPRDGNKPNMPVTVSSTEYKSPVKIKTPAVKTNEDTNFVNEIKTNILLTKDIVKEVKKDVSELKDRLGKMETNLTAEKSKHLDTSDGPDKTNVHINIIDDKVNNKQGIGELAHKLGGVIQSALRKISGNGNNDTNRTDIKTVTAICDTSPMKRKRDPRTNPVGVKVEKKLASEESMTNCPKVISKEIQYVKGGKTPLTTPLNEKATPSVNKTNDHATEPSAIQQQAKEDDDVSSESVVSSVSYTSNIEGVSQASSCSTQANSAASTLSRDSLTKIKNDLKKVNDRLQRFISSSTNLSQPSFCKPVSCTNLKVDTPGDVLASGDVASVKESGTPTPLLKDATPLEANEGLPHDKYGPPPYRGEHPTGGACGDDKSSDESDGSSSTDGSNDFGNNYEYLTCKESFKPKSPPRESDSQKVCFLKSPPVQLTSSKSKIISDFEEANDITHENGDRADHASEVASGASTSVSSNVSSSDKSVASEAKYVSSENGTVDGFVGTISDQSDSISKCQLFVDKCQQFIDEQANRADVTNSLSSATQDSPSNEKISDVVGIAGVGRESILYNGIGQQEMKQPICNTSYDGSELASEESDIDIINGVFDSVCDHSEIISKCRELVDEQAKQIQADLESISEAEYQHKQFLEILEDLEAILSDTSIARPSSNHSICSSNASSKGSPSSISAKSSVNDLHDFSSGDMHAVKSSSVTNVSPKLSDSEESINILQMFPLKSIEKPIQSDTNQVTALKLLDNEQDKISVDNTVSCCSEVIVPKTEVTDKVDYDWSDESLIDKISNSSEDNSMKDISERSESPKYMTDSQSEEEPAVKLDSQLEKQENLVTANSVKLDLQLEKQENLPTANSLKSYYKSALDTITSFVKGSAKESNSSDVPPTEGLPDDHKISAIKEGTLQFTKNSPSKSDESNKVSPLRDTLLEKTPRHVIKTSSVVNRSSSLKEKSLDVPNNSPLKNTSPDLAKHSPLKESLTGVPEQSHQKESSTDVTKHSPLKEISTDEPKPSPLEEISLAKNSPLKENSTGIPKLSSLKESSSSKHLPLEESLASENKFSPKNESLTDERKQSPLKESSIVVPRHSPIETLHDPAKNSPHKALVSPKQQTTPNMLKTPPANETTIDAKEDKPNETSTDKTKMIYLSEPSSKPKRKQHNRQSRFSPPSNSYALLSATPEVGSGIINTKSYIDNPSSRVLEAQKLQSAKATLHDANIERLNETLREQVKVARIDEKVIQNEQLNISDRLKQLSEFSSDTANSKVIVHENTALDPHLNRYLYQWSKPEEAPEKADDKNEKEETFYAKMGKSLAEAFSNTIETLEERFVSPPLSARDSRKAAQVSNITTPHGTKLSDLKPLNNGECGDCKEKVNSKSNAVKMNSPKGVGSITQVDTWDETKIRNFPLQSPDESDSESSIASASDSSSVEKMVDNFEKADYLKNIDSLKNADSPKINTPKVVSPKLNSPKLLSPKVNKPIAESPEDDTSEVSKSFGNGEEGYVISESNTSINSAENSINSTENTDQKVKLTDSLSELKSEPVIAPKPRKELFGFRRGLRKVLNPQKELFGFRRGLRKLGERLSGTDLTDKPREDKIKSSKLSTDELLMSDVKDEPPTKLSSEKEAEQNVDIKIDEYINSTSPIPEFCASSVSSGMSERNADDNESVSSSMSGYSSHSSDFGTDESIRPTNQPPSCSEKSDTDKEGSLASSHDHLSQTDHNGSDMSASESDSDSESRSFSASDNSSIADVVDSNMALHSSVICMPTCNSLTNSVSFSSENGQRARNIHGGDSEIILAPTQLEGNNIVCKPVFYNPSMGMPTIKTLKGNSMQSSPQVSDVGYSWSPDDKRIKVCQDSIDTVMPPEKKESDIHLNLLHLFNQIDKLETEMGEAFGPNKNCQSVDCKVSLDDVELSEDSIPSPTVLSESDSQEEYHEDEPEFDDLYTIMQPSFPPEESSSSFFSGNVHPPIAREGFRVQELDSCYHPGLEVQEQHVVRHSDMQLCDFTLGDPTSGTKLKLKPIIDDVPSKDSQFDIRNLVNIQPSTFSVPFPEFCSSRMNTKDI